MSERDLVAQKGLRSDRSGTRTQEGAGMKLLEEHRGDLGGREDMKTEGTGSDWEVLGVDF